MPPKKPPQNTVASEALSNKGMPQMLNLLSVQNTETRVKQKTFANESLYRICTETTGVVWGGAMYICTAQNYTNGSKSLFTILSFFAILGLIWSLMAIKTQLEKRKIQSFSLQRSRKLMACEFGWKILFYGFIALIPAVTKEFNIPNITLSAFLDTNPGLAGVLTAHIFFILPTIYFLKVEAEDERLGDTK